MHLGSLCPFQKLREQSRHHGIRRSDMQHSTLLIHDADGTRVQLPRSVRKPRHHYTVRRFQIVERERIKLRKQFIGGKGVFDRKDVVPRSKHSPAVYNVRHLFQRQSVVLYRKR